MRRVFRRQTMVAAALMLASIADAASATQTREPTRPAVAPAQLDRAIDGVLAGPEFQWRLRPPAEKAAESASGPIARFFRQGAEIIAEAFRAIGRWIGRAVNWLERHLLREPTAEKTSGGTAVALVRVLLYALMGAAVLLIGWIIWLIVKRSRGSEPAVVQAQAVTAAAPDLRDESVQAAQLPADGWLALAREQSARGEWRLALRALYLATLARFAADGLIALAKFKTNLDYEREVRRRALSRAEIAAHFAARRREFEDVWYGHAQPAEEQVRAWMAEFERPTA